MAPPPGKFPRRYAQRQALRLRNKTSDGGLQSQAQRRRHKQQIARQSDRSSQSGSESDSDLDTEEDSGYASDTNDEAEYLNGLVEKFRQMGPQVSNLGDVAKQMIQTEMDKFKKFCKKSKRDWKEALKACEPLKPGEPSDASIFKTYLLWRVKHSRVKKESSAITYWKVLSMGYAQETHRYMDEGVLYDMKNWIPAFLTPKCVLDDSEKEKASLFVEDLCVMQNVHWVRDTEVFPHERFRVQGSALHILSGCTGTRPKALVGKRPLLYEDIQFQVFPPSTKGGLPRVAMTLNLKHIKRSGGKSRRKKFTFYDHDGNLICNPVMYMLALALADNAFKNNFTGPEDIYSLVVPSETDRIRLQWKGSWTETPIFRDTENTANGIRISRTKALQYPKHRHHFIRLGRSCGFEKVLEFYDLRRASGKELTKAVTADERGQILGQQDPSTYRRYYQPDVIDRDCQAIYLGTIPQDDLVRRVGRLPRDLRAPPALTDAQKSEVMNDPKLLRLYEKRDKLSKKIKETYSTIKAAQGTQQHTRHKRLQARIVSKKNQLLRKRLEKATKDFFATINTEDVNKQLQGILPSTEVLTPSAIEYELEERAVVARLFFEYHNDLKELELFQIRMEIIRNLRILCRRQESDWRSIKTRQCLLSKDKSKAIQTPDVAVETSLSIPDEQMLLYCPFCRCDEEAGPKKRNKLFARIDALRRHVREQHLEYMRPNEGFNCPYEGCITPLKGAMHFINHTASQHGLCLLPLS